MRAAGRCSKEWKYTEKLFELNFYFFFPLKFSASCLGAGCLTQCVPTVSFPTASLMSRIRVISSMRFILEMGCFLLYIALVFHLQSF